MKLDYKRPPLAAYQTKIIDCKKRFTVCEASTKSGKTVSHIVWLFEKALEDRTGVKAHQRQEKEGMEYWWVAPVSSQAEIAFNRMQRFLSQKGFFKVNKTKLTLQLPNGAMIRFKSADKPDSLYGENVYAAVFDEFTRAKETAWAALRSTLTATKGPCKFIGNYTGASNWGHKLSKKAKKANSEYAYFKINAWDAVREGVLEESEILQAKEDLPYEIFRALYLAEGNIDKAKLFDDEAISDIFTNSFVTGSKRYITSDIALEGSDMFVTIVWEGWRVIHIEVMPKSSGEQVVNKIKALALQFGVPNSRIAYDNDGVGGFVKGYIRGAVSFVNNSRALNGENYYNLRSQCYYILAKKANERLVFITDKFYQSKIEEELAAIKSASVDKGGKLRVVGKDVIKLLIDRSPDFADALMMRSLFDLKSKSKSKYV